MSEVNDEPHWLSERFRGYLPVVIDIETGGFNSVTDAVLEVGACILGAKDDQLVVEESLFFEVKPFKDANIEQSALQFTGIDPFAEGRKDISEKDAFKNVFSAARTALKKYDCKRAILVGHNAAFDMNFMNAAIERNNIKRSPFHPFSTLDTVSLGALWFQQTVLAKCCQAADIDFDNNEAHNAGYDAEKTAELFCLIVNDHQNK